MTASRSTTAIARCHYCRSACPHYFQAIKQRKLAGWWWYDVQQRILLDALRERENGAMMPRLSDDEKMMVQMGKGEHVQPCRKDALGREQMVRYEATRLKTTTTRPPPPPPSRNRESITMNSHQTASRITDVVPANFLCDHQTMQKVANSQLVDEKALSLVELNLPSALFLHYIALFQSRQRPVFKEIVASYRTQALILQVCCCWRNTALPDPRLWTTIPLLGSGEGSDDEEDVYGKEEKSFAHPMITGSTQERASYWKALEKTLNQTSYLPLQLLFHFNADGNIGNHDNTIFSLQTFVRLLPQANTISLYIYCRKHQVHTARVIVFDKVLECKLLSAIPNIEVLELRAWDIEQWFVDVPTAGHRLHSFHISRKSDSISLAEVLNLLDHAPLLETLKLTHINLSHPGGTIHAVTHERLSMFHLSRGEKEENDTIFGHLTLPALRSLLFGGDNHPWPCPNNLSFSSGLVLNLSADGQGDDRPLPMPILEFLSATPKVALDQPLPALTVLRVSTEQANDRIEKDKHTALFEAFRNEGVTIRISYSNLYYYPAWSVAGKPPAGLDSSIMISSFSERFLGELLTPYIKLQSGDHSMEAFVLF
ncbi:hypothetical protein CPB85DRAFT_1254446 [Mucidula mucida]|nr:hypothetical protein CPB85DRAFT_1254446 [Mucidula mucida]